MQSDNKVSSFLLLILIGLGIYLLLNRSEGFNSSNNFKAIYPNEPFVDVNSQSPDSPDSQINDSQQLSDEGFESGDQILELNNQAFSSNDQVFDSSNQVFNSNNQDLNDQAFSSSDLGFKSNDQAFGSSDQGFESNDQAFGSSDQGFESNDQPFGSTDLGFESSNQGFGSSNQGFNSSNQGFNSSNQGFNSSNQGYNLPLNNQLPKVNNQTNNFSRIDNKNMSSKSPKKIPDNSMNYKKNNRNESSIFNFEPNDSIFSSFGTTLSDAFLPPIPTGTDTDSIDFKKQNMDNYNAKDFLPNEINDEWFETDFSLAKYQLNDDKLINTERYIIGINTVGQSLKNASYDIRGTIPNPKFVVSPWGNSTYEPDFNLKPLC